MDGKIVIRKNILDNHFQKQLQIASMSHRISWKSFTDISLIIIISVFVLGLAGFFFIRSARKLKRIMTAIENLEYLI